MSKMTNVVISFFRYLWFLWMISAYRLKRDSLDRYIRESCIEAELSRGWYAVRKPTSCWYRIMREGQRGYLIEVEGVEFSALFLLKQWFEENIRPQLGEETKTKLQQLQDGISSDSFCLVVNRNRKKKT